MRPLHERSHRVHRPWPGCPVLRSLRVLRSALGSTPYRRRLAACVRRLRLARGWSQEELGERAELHERTVRDVEAGRLNVTLDTLELLARAFAIDLPQLFEEA